MFRINTSSKSLLGQIPGPTNKQAALPPEQAMRILRPALSQHADLKAVDLFEQWILDRGTNISLERLAHLWVHYERCFILELPQRFILWGGNKTSRSPYQLGIDFMRLVTLRRWTPWVLRKSGSLWGRAQIKAVLAVGHFLMFIVFFWVALGVWMALGSIREPLLIGIASLGLA